MHYPRLGVIVPCYNDAKYLNRSLMALNVAGVDTVCPKDIVVVLDKDTDLASILVAGWFHSMMGNMVMNKESYRMRNHVADSLELGFNYLRDCDFVAVVAADTVVPPDYWEDILPGFFDDSVVSVAGLLISTNPVYRGYERWLDRIGLRHSIRGSGRVYRMSAIRKLMDEGRVMDDVLAEDISLDRRLGRLGGLKVITGNVITKDIRKFSLGKSVLGQFRSGRARRQLGVPFVKLVGELPRLRPFVLVGWLVGGAS